MFPILCIQTSLTEAGFDLGSMTMIPQNIEAIRTQLDTATGTCHMTTLAVMLELNILSHYVYDTCYKFMKSCLFVNISVA